MSVELSDEQLDILLSSADGFVGQGGSLVEELAGAVRQLRGSLITVNMAGRSFRLDRVAECEDSLDIVREWAAGVEAELDAKSVIVKDLAAASPYGTSIHGCCKFCGWHKDRIGGPHNPATCLWRRARDIEDPA